MAACDDEFCCKLLHCCKLLYCTVQEAVSINSIKSNVQEGSAMAVWWISLVDLSGVELGSADSR